MHMLVIVGRRVLVIGGSAFVGSAVHRDGVWSPVLSSVVAVELTPVSPDILELAQLAQKPSKRGRYWESPKFGFRRK